LEKESTVAAEDRNLFCKGTTSLKWKAIGSVTLQSKHLKGSTLGSNLMHSDALDSRLQISIGKGLPTIKEWAIAAASRTPRMSLRGKLAVIQLT
jgi:hypothetical protein